MASPKESGLESLIPDEATLYDKVKAKFRKPKLTRKQALLARPVRNPALQWEQLDNGEVRIILPRRDDRIGKVLSVLFYVPKSRPVSLDMVGASVWQLCDGEHTVEDIVEALRDEHRLHRREAEVSLTEFLKTLGKRHMVAFIVPTEFLKGEDAEKPTEPKEEGNGVPRSAGKPKRGSSKRGKGRKREDR